MAGGSKIKASTNAIGDFGETLAQAHFSRPVRGAYRRPLFRASHLGEKYPVVDFIVDILDANEDSLGFFFVQVKATKSAKSKAKTLALQIEKTKYNKLAQIPAPTFLVGVDIVAEEVYLVCAPKPAKRAFSSICKKHDLKDDGVRVALYKEVRDYWKKHSPALNQIKTQFKNER
jgi:hypothetical protein